MISSVPPRPSPLAPGYHLDRYELLSPLAEGGMASVWLARQYGKLGFQKLVAVKTILPRFAADPAFRRMFLEEARVVSLIDHPNVVHVLDLGESAGVVYLVMEWIEGDTLLKLERACAKASMAIPQPILVRILLDALVGLHAAHEMTNEEGKPLGLVHRDISPHNLLVSRVGVTKVIDFGIAKARDRLNGGETTTGVVKGKLAYMAPEQALAQRVDRRADLWAIGAIFYRIVKGKPPYRASDPMATMDLVAGRQGLDPLPTEGILPGVRQVMMKALSPAAEGRFATAAEMHSALEAATHAKGACASTRDVAEFLARFMAPRSGRQRVAAEPRTPRPSADPKVGGRRLAVPLQDIRSDDPTSRYPSGPSDPTQDSPDKEEVIEVPTSWLEPVTARLGPVVGRAGRDALRADALRSNLAPPGAVVAPVSSRLSQSPRTRPQRRGWAIAVATCAILALGTPLLGTNFRRPSGAAATAGTHPSPEAPPPAVDLEGTASIPQPTAGLPTILTAPATAQPPPARTPPTTLRPTTQPRGTVAGAPASASARPLPAATEGQPRPQTEDSDGI